MASIVYAFGRFQEGLWARLSLLDGLAPLALRLYLFFPLWAAGTQKISDMGNTIEWFGNSEWGLGLPFPALLAPLAAYTEALGAVLLLLGLATRWICVPLMIVMLVATFAVHWSQGWSAIADSAAPDIAQRLSRATELLQEFGNYDWLTERGSLVILNNGTEFAVTYLIMLLALLFTGGGRFVSLDYYLGRVLYR